MALVQQVAAAGVLAVAAASLAGCGSGSSPPSPPSPPAPRLDVGWWEQTARSRTVSPACTGMKLHELLVLVDELHEGGVGALTLNSAYDAGDGYDQGDLWCGLAASNLTKVNPLIGTDEDWEQLVTAVHGKNMALMTWLNPSYFWTGSPSFKQAEHDVKRWGIDSLPNGSPARWFRWSTDSNATAGPPKPSDDSPEPPNEGVWQWVWDEQAGAAYFSTWANQPTTDWTSLEWHVAIRDILRFWIEDKGVDGFVFDYPDGYLAAGSDSRGLWEDNPRLMKEHLTMVVRELGGGRVAAFAEIYQTPERTMAYGFDGSVSDTGDNALAVAIGKGVQLANTSGFEELLSAAGGPDAMTAQCWFADTEHCPISWARAGGLHASWLPGTELESNNLNCFEGNGAVWHEDASSDVPLGDCFQLCSEASECEGVTVRWDGKSDGVGESHVDCLLRGGIDQANCDRSDEAFSTFAMDAPARARLAVALSSATVGLTAVEIAGDGNWWSNAPWPGSTGDAPFLHALKGTSAFGAGSLRVPLPSAEGAYAVLRYDARRGGEAAIAVFNLQSEAVAVNVDLSSLPTDDLSSVVVYPADTSWERLSNTFHVQLPAHGYALHSLSPLPRWESIGHLSCYEGGGASYAPDSSGDMSLGACLLECLRDSRCEAVTVYWLSDPVGAVSCYKRGGITPDQCDATYGAAYSTFAVAEALSSTDILA